MHEIPKKSNIILSGGGTDLEAWIQSLYSSYVISGSGSSRRYDFSAPEAEWTRRKCVNAHVHLSKSWLNLHRCIMTWFVTVIINVSQHVRDSSSSRSHCHFVILLPLSPCCYTCSTVSNCFYYFNYYKFQICRCYLMLCWAACKKNFLFEHTAVYWMTNKLV